MNKRQILLLAASIGLLGTLPANAQQAPGFCAGEKYSNTIEQTCSFQNLGGAARVVGATFDALLPIDVKIYQTSDPTNVIAECSTSPGLPVLTNKGLVCTWVGLNDLPVGELLTCDVTGFSGAYACESYA